MSASRFMVVFLAFSIYWQASGSRSCVKTFHEFEKATIFDNLDNVNALVDAFFKPNRPSPLSVHVIYHFNGTSAFISTDPECPPEKEMWLWIPSPVFLFMEPTKLNLWALFTLNFFNNWSTGPRVAHIYVPDICNISHNKFNFLNDLTSRVSYE